MKKALNFDLDTKKYIEFTKSKATKAYIEIKKFLKRNEFEHRQGSGYISKYSLSDVKVFAIIQKMSIELKWLKNCVKQIDVTNIGKQHSMIDIINKSVNEDKLLYINNIKINNNKESNI